MVSKLAKETKPVGSPEAAKSLVESKDSNSSSITTKFAGDHNSSSANGSSNNSAGTSMTKRLNSLTDLAKDVQVGSTSKDNADKIIKQMKTLAEKSQSDSNTNDDIQGIKADEINQNFKAYSHALVALFKGLLDKKSTLKPAVGKDVRQILEEIKTHYSAIAVKAGKMTDRFALKQIKEDTENEFGKVIIAYSDGEPQEQGQVAKSKL